MMTLKELGEDELVRRITEGLPQGDLVLTGPGDDCAVVRHEHGSLLLKTDALVEGIHFLPDAQPELIGRKALARAVSDMGAMGGKPLHALVTLVAPPQESVQRVLGIYRGMSEVAEQYGVSIVGGETARGPQLLLNVALTGYAPLPVLRSTASEGDFIVVTGALGGSITGKHFSFIPRLAEGQWLAQHGYASAMMDLSDGLAKDLPRLAAASGLEFQIDPALLPCTPGSTPAQAWGDGEDYELLFTCKADRWPELERAWPAEFPPLTCIGSMCAMGQGSQPKLGTSGWDHFL
jgi:thiamine-monophosphate kinase